jgi:hypothetical protein
LHERGIFLSALGPRSGIIQPNKEIAKRKSRAAEDVLFLGLRNPDDTTGTANLRI